MANATFYPAISGDDGYSWNTSLNTNDSVLYMGSYGGTSYSVFVRFPNVTIPIGSIITTAYTTFVANETQTGNTVNVNVYGNDEDDATAPTNGTEFLALSLTSGIAWNSVVGWSDNSSYNSPELKTVIQSIVNRDGWAINQAMMIVFIDNSSTAPRLASSVDYSGGSQKPSLYIEWEVPPPYEVEGYIYEKGLPVERQLYLYDRSSGLMVNSTTSSGNGYYNMTTTISGEHFIVCLDDAGGEQYNDLIRGPIIPDNVVT